MLYMTRSGPNIVCQKSSISPRITKSFHFNHYIAVSWPPKIKTKVGTPYNA